MPNETLPPGWTGTIFHHRTDFPGVRLMVTNHEFRWSDYPHRWGWYLTTADGKVVDAGGTVSGYLAVALARADGLAAVEAFARKLLEQTAQLRAKETA